MITGTLKTRIDKLWEEFWTGGITNPLTVIEQISFLAFARLLDIRESTEQKKHNRLHPGKRFRGLFTADQQDLRWQNFKNLGGEAMLPLVRDKVFPHFRKLGEQAGRLGEYMKDAQLMIQKPSLMVSAVNMIDALPLTAGDTKGDLYEYLLSKLTTAGINGPPFKGSLDANDVHTSLTGKVKTKKTELLFLVLMLRMLKLGGRCAVIVPDGVLFGSSKAHVELRKLLVEANQLEAVVKLPAGVFKPYAGVSTAILIFTKGGRTEHVWYYDVQADGFSLDDKRDEVAENDLPDVCERWVKRNPKKDKDRTAKTFFVTKKEIAENGYDLSVNRYKEIEHDEVKHDPPIVILKRLKKIEMEIGNDLEELETMLST